MFSLSAGGTSQFGSLLSVSSPFRAGSDVLINGATTISSLSVSGSTFMKSSASVYGAFIMNSCATVLGCNSTGKQFVYDSNHKHGLGSFC